MPLAARIELGRVCLERLDQHTGRGDTPPRDAELPAQLAHFADIQLEREPPLPRQRASRDRGRDVRVAVAVAADPRPVTQQRRRIGLAAVVLAHGAAQIAPYLGDGIPDRVFNEVQAVGDLLVDGRPRDANLVGGEEQPNLIPDRGAALIALARRQVDAAHPDKLLGEALLLEQHAAPASFRRVGRQGWLDVEAGQKGFDGLEAEPQRLQVRDGLVDRFRRRAAPGGLGALAVDPHDLLLLGLVDEVEEGRERAQQPDDRAEVELANPVRRPRETCRRIGIRGVRAQRAQLGSDVEYVAARFFRDDAAEEVAEQADVFGQGLRYGELRGGRRERPCRR